MPVAHRGLLRRTPCYRSATSGHEYQVKADLGAAQFTSRSILRRRSAAPESPQPLGSSSGVEAPSTLRWKEMARRCCWRTRNWWRVPEYGPSNPRACNRPTNSRLLHGVHRLTCGLLVQVDTGNRGQGVFEFQAHQNPMLESRTQFLLTLAKRLGERDHTAAGRRPAYEPSSSFS